MCATMSDMAEYLWLEQQGEAFGSPGLEPRWTSSVKDAVGTAYSAASRVWFTCSHGILNEMYFPTIDHAQVRDMEFLVTDGETFFHEEKRDLVSSFAYIDPEGLGVRYVNSDPDGRYKLTKEILCDPHRATVLMRVRLEGHEELLPRLRLYALLAPHLDDGGADNTARALDVAGQKLLLAWKGPWAVAMGASCGFSRVSCGFVGASDGWRDLKENFRMDWEFGSATGGNVAMMGELNLGNAEAEARTWTWGRGHRSRRRAGIYSGDRLRRRSACGIARNRNRFGEAFRAASRAVHRAMAAGCESGVAGGQVGRWR